LAATTVAALAGCGSSSSGGGTGDDTTLRLWHGFTEADGKIVDQIVKNFNESQDVYTVVSETIAWSSLTEKLLTGLKSGDGPHIVAQGPDGAEGYVAQGAFVECDDFYASGEYESAEHFYPNFVDMVTWDDKRSGVPMGAASFCVWYNTKHWEEAGLADDDVPTTVEDFLDVAKKLTKTSGSSVEQYGVAMPDQDAATVGAILHSGGGDFITDGVAALDTPQNVETLTTWQKAFVEDQISPTGMDLVAAAQLFNSGKASMLLNGPWQITGAEDSGLDVNVFAWPGDWVQAAATFWFASNLVKEDTQRKGVFEFFQYFNNPDSQVLWTSANYPPNRDDIASDEFATELVATMADFSQAGRLPITGVKKNINDINSEVGSMMGKITTGGDVAGLLTQTQATVDGYLEG
jgi:multiple sugar transport system substrate-binding protein